MTTSIFSEIRLVGIPVHKALPKMMKRVDYQKKLTRPLAVDESAEAAKILSKAFHDDPMIGFFFPDKGAEYTPREKFIHSMTLKGGFLLDGVTGCFLNGKLYGVSILIKPEEFPIKTSVALKSGFWQIPFMVKPFELLRILFYLLKADESLKKIISEKRIWNLFEIGVDPSVQKHGIGSALMERMINITNSEAVPFYLQTSTETNVDFYRKFGFKLMSIDRYKWFGKKPQMPPIWNMKLEP